MIGFSPYQLQPRPTSTHIYPLHHAKLDTPFPPPRHVPFSIFIRIPSLSRRPIHTNQYHDNGIDCRQALSLTLGGDVIFSCNQIPILTLIFSLPNEPSRLSILIESLIRQHQHQKHHARRIPSSLDLFSPYLDILSVLRLIQDVSDSFAIRLKLQFQPHSSKTPNIPQFLEDCFEFHHILITEKMSYFPDQQNDNTNLSKYSSHLIIIIMHPVSCILILQAKIERLMYSPFR